jgi:hypothetical protein
MQNLPYLKSSNLLDRNSEEFIQWLSEASYQNWPQHDNFWTLFYLLEMRARHHQVLVIDNYDLAHQRNETLTKINSFLRIPSFPLKQLKQLI